MNEVLKRIENWFAQRNKVLVAFSGGVDSCLVAYLARKYLGRENAIAVISKSPSLKKKDLDTAREFCKRYDIKLEEIVTNELENPDYQRNPINRCYFCKSTLYGDLEELIVTRHPDYDVLNGNNFSDVGDYRPGLKAARQYNVYSPLAECEVEKSEVRSLARHFELFTWDKPASPCLSSRFPYGETITIEKLRMVEDAENILNEYGFNDVRIRFINKSARIEVPSESLDKLRDVYAEIAPRIMHLGFRGCSIDEEGLISGKLNREIKHVRQS